MLNYLFIFLTLSFSNLIFALGLKTHIYNVSPYPIKAWANYIDSACSSSEIIIAPNSPPSDWQPPFFCFNMPIKDINYEFTDTNGLIHKYWITSYNNSILSYLDDMDICIYGDPQKDSYYITDNWNPCKPYIEICKDPVYGITCETRTGLPIK